VLVTGAWGLIGQRVVEALRQRGHDVVALDRRSPRGQRLARRAAQARGVEVRWGDIRDAAVLDDAVRGVDAAIHLAAVLPPVTEDHPELAHAINVGGTSNLRRALAEHAPRARLIHTSSVSVHGSGLGESLVGEQTPVVESDVYTRTKIAAEGIVRDYDGAWLITRVGVALVPFDPKASVANLKAMLRVSPDAPLEVVHPLDVATALAAAVERDDVWGRVLPIGGGPSCRIRVRDLWAMNLGAAGVGTLQDHDLGRAAYYTAWMDTEESARLLGYQRHDLAAIHAELLRAYRPLRWLVRPLSPLLRVALRRLAKAAIAELPAAETSTGDALPSADAAPASRTDTPT
jgi:nucleoside-diphosphate-sugar epimerase